MQGICIPVQIEPEAEELGLPKYMTAGASGMDVCSSSKEPIVLAPGEVKLVPTGLRFAIPKGYEIQVRPRSGLALKHSISLMNTPGTIDSDYRGLLSVIMVNFGKESFQVDYGMRVAQIVLQQVCSIQWESVKSLDETERASGGFGHTGH